MQLNELRNYLENQFTYPVDEATIRERIGDETIDSEEKSDGRSIETVLDNHRDDEFASINELHQTMLGELPDEYVGRKYYDDRGSNPEQPRDSPREDRTESL